MTQVWETLAWPDGGQIIYLILDGMGGLPAADGGTELQVAHTPNLDRLARQASCGLLELVGPGITPGSGPGHLALFGYDPLRYQIGRGVLSALGIGFELQPGDVAARANFATLDEAGRVCDRRAGRIDSELNRTLCDKIRQQVSLDFDGEIFFETVSQHRAVLVLRGDHLGGQLQDTDPQMTGRRPLAPVAQDEASERTGRLVQQFLSQVEALLADSSPANGVLLRGFERYQPLPSLTERFQLRGLCIADYPMYRGVSRLIGMEVVLPPGGLAQRFQVLEDAFSDQYDFYFLHVKQSDSSGEDSNFQRKVAVIEQVDQLLPKLLALEPAVLVVAADHATPAVMGRHSWHPVPVMLASELAQADTVQRFNELDCLQGALGLRPGVHIMGLALAHAGRLQKFGA
ncbi:MAG: 2,3-bisphosphoglycerate-independent phosphoglycerate mutase [Leptolyngbya sp. SIO4C1]|nr:2,3-bisphosphoglycerate-independent phosphoglycerate mutase [Leptolyngbya sp. SIO4C1]